MLLSQAQGLREFKFDAVLGEDSEQSEVYSSAPQRGLQTSLGRERAMPGARSRKPSGQAQERGSAGPRLRLRALRGERRRHTGQSVRSG